MSLIRKKLTNKKTVHFVISKCIFLLCRSLNVQIYKKDESFSSSFHIIVIGVNCLKTLETHEFKSHALLNKSLKILQISDEFRRWDGEDTFRIFRNLSLLIVSVTANSAPISTELHNVSPRGAEIPSGKKYLPLMQNVCLRENLMTGVFFIYLTILKSQQ